ncbi:YciC family protein [Candidatus Profftia sp. (ex Adelges kitamiensis)]|uniref:YciC family protein n=1 Tax=Candidatus Profftia sp. (ex Adelges kitamiensis) TaxID=2864218 RepID=UPI001CE3809C|nr:YciC family protein [Candidatus Profftia sp. (ex Adelges kitamiensis)]
MSITARRLYRDTFNFFFNQLNTICFLGILTAFISMILNQIFTLGGYDIGNFFNTNNTLISGINFQELIKQMTPEQQIVLLKVSAAASLSALIGNIVLLGSMLVLIPSVSEGKYISAPQAIYDSIPMLPRLLLLMFLCTLIVQLGITVFIVPGIMLAVGFSLSPIILSKEKTSVFRSIQSSFRISFINVRFISPVMIIWLAVKLTLLLLARIIISTLHPNISTIIISSLSHFASAFLIIYLSRLYMLIK